MGDIVSFALEAQRRFNVFHQKIQVVRNDGGIHAYCGGIDLNANRTQTPAHASRGPFHDVHARVDGPAAGELATTFIERWRRVAPATTLTLDAAGAFDDLPTSAVPTSCRWPAPTTGRPRDPVAASPVRARRRAHHPGDTAQRDRPGTPLHLHRGPVPHPATAVHRRRSPMPLPRSRGR